MAAHEETRFTSSPCLRLDSVSRAIWSFCRCPTRVAFTVSAFCSSTRNESTRSCSACDVVEHVAEPAPHLELGLVALEVRPHLRDDLGERRDRPLEHHHLAGQLVDPLRHVPVAAEQLVLDLVDVVLQAGDDGEVVVDDPVGDA